jgi:protein gp37
MTLTKTGIEYLNYCWNFYTGCENKQRGICPVPDCWAASMAKRFGRSFEPTLHPEKLLDPLKHKAPAKIGVCFTGDLFGECVNPNERIELEWVEYQDYFTLAENVFKVMDLCPQHQFYFLTKNPAGYQKWGKFPDNCFIGATVCNDGMFVMAMPRLFHMEAKYKWLSIEPLMGRIDIPPKYLTDAGISWVVIGGFSGGKNPPKIEWIEEIVSACDEAGIKVWLKDNLKSYLDTVPTRIVYQYGSAKLRQELPL